MTNRIFLDLLRKSARQDVYIENPIIIIEQPQSIVIEEGSSLSPQLVIHADNVTTYQWFKVPDILLIGENANVLSFDSPKFSDAGAYFCLLQNMQGISFKSNFAEVTVNRKAEDVYHLTQRIGIGDSLEKGVGIADNSSSFDIPFLIGDHTLSKTIWRTVNNPLSIQYSFGYPGLTAKWVLDNALSEIKLWVIDNARKVFDVYFGTNDLGQMTPQQFFDDYKALCNAIRATFPDCRIIVKTCLHRKDVNVNPIEFDARRRESAQLLIDNYNSDFPFMDGLVDLSKDNRIWSSTVPDDPTLMTSPDKDNLHRVHYSKKLCDYIAEDSVPVYKELGWKETPLADVDLSGGSALPAVDVEPTQQVGLFPVNILFKDRIYKHLNSSIDGGNWDAFMLLNKKIPAGQDGYVQYEIPQYGRWAMFGLKTKKTNTSYTDGYHINSWSGGGYEGFSVQDNFVGSELKIQAFQGDIIRYTRNIIGGQGYISMWRSCLDKSKFVKLKTFNFKSIDDLYIQICLRQDGLITGLKASTNCIEI